MPQTASPLYDIDTTRRRQRRATQPQPAPALPRMKPPAAVTVALPDPQTGQVEQQTVPVITDDGTDPTPPAPTIDMSRQPVAGTDENGIKVYGQQPAPAASSGGNLYDIQTRQRRVSPSPQTTVPDYEQQAAADQQAARAAETGPPPHVSRAMAFLRMFGRGLGRQFQQPARTWEEFWTGVAGAGTEGVVGAIKPGIEGKIEQSYDVQRKKERATESLKVAQQQSVIDSRHQEQIYREQNQQRDVKNDERRARDAELDDLRQVWNGLDNFDPKSNQQHRKMAERAEALGSLLPDKHKGDAAHVTIERWQGHLLLVDKDKGTATAITKDGAPLVDQSELPVEITIGGQKFTVSQNAGASALATYLHGQQEATTEAAQAGLTNAGIDASLKRVEESINYHNQALADLVTKNGGQIPSAYLTDAQGQMVKDDYDRPVSNPLAAEYQRLAREKDDLEKEQRDLMLKRKAAPARPAPVKVTKPVPAKRDPAGLFQQ